MRNCINIIVLIFFKITIFCQTIPPPDSLTGTYSGIFRTKTSIDANWTTYIDTVQINEIDTSNCLILSIKSIGFFQPSYPWVFYTNYYYCKDSLVNFYWKFFNGDSVCYIANNGPMPPPYTYTKSGHFYGKRINKNTTGIKSLKSKTDINIYPNPSNGAVEIDNNELSISNIEVYNVLGNKIFQKSIYQQASIKFNLQKGIYLVHLTIKNEVIIKKIIIL